LRGKCCFPSSGFFRLLDIHVPSLYSSQFQKSADSTEGMRNIQPEFWNEP
jgi:hypothetical protein